jgi:hypothetical protein
MSNDSSQQPPAHSGEPGPQPDNDRTRLRADISDARAVLGRADVLIHEVGAPAYAGMLEKSLTTICDSATALLDNLQDMDLGPEQMGGLERFSGGWVGSGQGPA